MRDLKPAKDAQRSEWAITKTDIFDDSLARHSVVFPDLPEKLDKFKGVKRENPIRARYGKHDGPLTYRLVGFWHCHLRDDAVLIYNLVNRAINLVCIVSHAEIEGRRLCATAEKLSKYNIAKTA